MKNEAVSPDPRKRAGRQKEYRTMKNTITAKESRFTYTANGIKGKKGEIIGGIGQGVNYLPAWYDFDPVALKITLTVKKYDQLKVIPNGCTLRNDSDLMTDYFDKDKLTIPATAGAEFLAAAIGWRKYVETVRKKGEKSDYYKREAERADRSADALKLAEQIASGELANGEQIIAVRKRADDERKERARREQNKRFAADLLKDGSKGDHTVEQVGDLVIYRGAQRMNIFDGSAAGWGREETLETVIAINTKTGEREQVQDVTLAEAYEFYKKFTA